MRFVLRVLVLLSFVAGARAAAPDTRIDWEKFLARHDLTWASLPTRWEESAFIGNGNLGATIFVQDGALAWEVNRADVYHNGSSGAQRYPMGRVALKTAGKITGGDMRLDLWNAEARGTVRTDKGTVKWWSVVSTNPGTIVIYLGGTDGETGVDLAWLPAEPKPPSEIHRKQSIPADLQHPAPEISETSRGADVATRSIQKFKGGGAFSAYLVRRQPRAGERAGFLSIGAGENGDAAVADAERSLDVAMRNGVSRLVADHRAWWHAYYPKSFVSFPDARLEAFYWIQVYKLGAAMRADGPVLDLMGPWFRGTPWPRIWWNLNIQLTYAPLMAANRLDLAESLFTNLDRHRDQLRRNAPEAIRDDAAVIGRSSGPAMDRGVNLATGTGGASLEAGNLPWVMFLYYNFYRVQMDDAVLVDRVLPLLGPTIGHYLAYVKKGDDGKYHLPKTHSPEFADVEDANYDLGFLKWGLQTLIAETERLKIADPRLPRWRDVLANLTPFPVDDTGLMIGKGRNLDASHRHYSHLVSIYPLHLLTPDDPANRALTEKSLAHWFSRPQAHKGYSNTGAASMHAMLGNGDAALAQLDTLLNTWIHPNTLYTESGPVIETPLSAMCGVHELFLQDWNGKLRVFPAVPRSWAEASFANLRADGAFLVSGVRREGRTAWVKIESLAGQPCRLLIPGWENAVVRAHTGAAAAPKVTRVAAGEFTIDLPKGASVTLAANANTALAELAPVATPAAQHNPYADRSGSALVKPKVPGVDF